MNQENSSGIWNALGDIFPSEDLRRGASMKAYTTLRLGGPADLLAEVSRAEQVPAALRVGKALSCPVTLLGNGSNLLVKDGGIEGLVLHIGEDFSQVSEPVSQPDGTFHITAQGGATLQKLANVALQYSLTGAEFLSGIPGTVGGAAYMNAGAYGGEMKDIVTRVILADEQGLHTVEGVEMNFGYRHSRLMETPKLTAVTSVTVALRPGDPAAIHATMMDYSQRRRSKQPLSFPSCGSTFKRPEGHFAGALIEGCGLKGARVGGASVSTLHAGFLLNDGGGTAADYLALIRLVQETVLKETGVQLEPEVRIIGREA